MTEVYASCPNLQDLQDSTRLVTRFAIFDSFKYWASPPIWRAEDTPILSSAVPLSHEPTKTRWEGHCSSQQWSPSETTLTHYQSEPKQGRREVLCEIRFHTVSHCLSKQFEWTNWDGASAEVSSAMLQRRGFSQLARHPTLTMVSAAQQWNSGIGRPEQQFKGHSPRHCCKEPTHWLICKSNLAFWAFRGGLYRATLAGEYQKGFKTYYKYWSTAWPDVALETQVPFQSLT